MADLLDTLLAEYMDAERERHAKMTPEEIEEEYRRERELRKRSHWRMAERKYIDTFVNESKVNETNEINNRGKLIKHFYGDTKLFKRTIIKLYVFNIFTICAILALLLFYPIKWGIIALIVVMIIGNLWYISDYRTYRIQKDCFLDIYENSLCGYAYRDNIIGPMDIGFSAVKWISVKYVDDIPEVVLKTIYGEIKFFFLRGLYGNDHNQFIITQQIEKGIENRSLYWTKHKFDWVSKMADSDELWDD